MDANEQKSFIRFLAQELKNHARELMVYQRFAHLLKQAGYVGVDEILDQARKTPELQNRLYENFEALEALLPPPDPDHSDRVKKLLVRDGNQKTDRQAKADFLHSGTLHAMIRSGASNPLPPWQAGHLVRVVRLTAARVGALAAA